MTSYLQAIAEAIRKWEYAEDCILSLILIGTNDEVGCRRIIDRAHGTPVFLKDSVVWYWPEKLRQIPEVEA